MKINSPSYSFQPLIIIGAARSGTKLLRDLIALHPGIDKVPYDVNYVWRIGNEHLIHDELEPRMVTEYAQQQIQLQIGKFSQNTSVLVEKTVSNCLRVPFVDEIYPDARYIHLLRDGHDVVESVYRQWTRTPDWRYILQKSRAFPIKIAPAYAFKYSMAIVRKILGTSGETRTTWGPIYDGMHNDMQDLSLLEVCALQWQKCVEHASNALETMPPEKSLTIRYADLVESPNEFLTSVANFIGIDSLPYETMNCNEVKRDNIGKGRRRLTNEEIEIITSYIEPTMDIQNSRNSEKLAKASKLTRK